MKFPYLDIKKLTQDEQDELIGRLELESKQMKQEFISLVSKTSQSLQANNVMPSDVILILEGYDIPGLTEDMKISTALSKIYKYCTFFNYEIIETIINQLGDDQDKKVLDKYEAIFKEYCKRRICEVPVDVLKSDKEPKTELRVKTDKNFNVPVEDIRCIGSKLSSLLGIKRLLLLNVKSGCIELIFDCFYSNCLENLKNCDLDTFKELGIIKIYTENHIYYEETAQESSLLHPHGYTGKQCW